MLPPRPRTQRIILHFDYDCFYAAVIEARTPALKSLPLAIQQKNLIVTCNYVARARGLHKLQPLADARRLCPDVVLVRGEDLTPFRAASTQLYRFIQGFAWDGGVERLGLDEVWVDVTDVVEWNLRHGPPPFFQLARDDPTNGFALDASVVAGHTFPPDAGHGDDDDPATLRLRLASHLARHIRQQLEQHTGYTATAGVACNKLLAKLVGARHKPNAQTTLMPPLHPSATGTSNILTFMDAHEVHQIPGIGPKLAPALHALVPSDGPLTVALLRHHPLTTPHRLHTHLAPGHQIWLLLHGIDDSPVRAPRRLPTQLGVENSYPRLDDMPAVSRELHVLARRLVRRMRVELLADDDADAAPPVRARKWLARPRTLRLTTRRRGGARTSHSAALPALRLDGGNAGDAGADGADGVDGVDGVAERLVTHTLLRMFRRLHPASTRWELTGLGVAVLNLVETEGHGHGRGRGLVGMWGGGGAMGGGGEDGGEDGGEENGGDGDGTMRPDAGTDCCAICHVSVPSFARVAHTRFHGAAHGVFGSGLG